MPVMKKAKANLLDSTGIDWFRHRVIGGHMLYNKELCRLDRLMDADNIMATQITGPNRGNHVFIHKNDIPGFGVFAYPQLGYRRMYAGVAAYIEYDPHGHGQGKRGLRQKSVKYAFSPISDLLLNKYYQAAQPKYGGGGDELMAAIFKPEYDKVEELDKLILGDKLQVILNHDVLIEPSIMPEDDDYIVYFKQRACGRFNVNKEFKWYSDKYKNAVTPLLGNYGVHK